MTDTDHARQNAASWSETIAEMIRALEAAHSKDSEIGAWREVDAAHTAIHEAALSVEVRSDWYTPCDANPEPVEYQILLSTGGPAVRITGRLNAYDEPETADLEYQDWGTPWTRYHPAHGEPLFDSHNADILTFAQQFFFGE